MDKQERTDAKQAEADLKRPPEVTKDLSPDDQDSEQIKGGYTAKVSADKW